MKYLLDLHHGIGDMVCFTPVMRNIIEADFHTEFDIIVQDKKYGDIFESFPGVKRIIELKDIKSGNLFFLDWRYDYGIIPPFIANKAKAYLLMKLMGCKKIFYQRNSVKWNKHICERCIDLDDIIGIPTVFRYPKLYCNYEFDKASIKGLNLNKRIIAICIGGNVIKNTSKSNAKMKGLNFKQWPLYNYISLANELKNKFNIIIFGGQKEKDELALSGLKFPDEAFVMLGNMSILDTCSLLTACNLVIGNDTGMMHVAGALGCSTLSIHGPTSPKMCGVYGPNAFFVENNSECKYCYENNGDKTFNCMKELACLKSIKVASVFDITLDILDKERSL